MTKKYNKDKDNFIIWICEILFFSSSFEQEHETKFTKYIFEFFRNLNSLKCVY